MPAGPDAAAVVRALGAGAATLDALAVRLGGGTREEVVWAVQDAVERGWVSSSTGEARAGDGVCAGAAPVVFAATEAGRTDARARG